MFFGVSRTVAQGGATLSPASFGLLTGLFGAGLAFSFLGAAAVVGGFIVVLLIPETLRREEAVAKPAEAPG